MKHRIDELESIRGLAALLIVLFHIPKWNQVLDIPFINNAHLMVGLFFVLSGFVIFNAYSDRINSFRELLRFQFLRLGRLYPVHLLFLFVFALIEIAKHLASERFGITSPNSLAIERNTVIAFGQNILLLSGVLPNTPLTFNYPAWSISVEFYTYLIFAGIVLWLNRYKTTAFIVLSIIATTLLTLKRTFGFEHLLQCVSGFSIGCLTAIAVQYIRVNIPSYWTGFSVLSVILLLQLKTTSWLDILIYPVTAILIIFLVRSRDGLAHRVLKMKFFTWLGAISYSVYMSHAAIEWAVGQMIRLMFNQREVITVDGRSIPHLSQLEAITASVVIVMLVIFISALTYSRLEKPLRDKSRKIAYQHFK